MYQQRVLLLMDTAAAIVAQIAALKQAGATWAQIAGALGCPDAKTAKAKAKRYARAAQVAMVGQGVAAAPGSGDGGTAA